MQILKARSVFTNAALKKFEAGTTLDDADLLTEGPMEAFRASLRQAKTRMELARDLVHKLEKIEDYDLDEIREIKNLAISVEGSAKTMHEQEAEE